MPMTADGLAKLLEESGEMQQVAAKKLAYFGPGQHPDGGGPLNGRLEEEMADVYASMDLVTETLGLDHAAIERRRAEKLAPFRRWHRDPRNGSESYYAVTTVVFESPV